MSSVPSERFDENYYRTSCGPPYERSPHWLEFFGALADQIVQTVAPRTVLDCGCAMGFLVEALRARGVEAFGFDISRYAIEQVAEDARPYCWAGSLLDPLPGRYDLVVCIEVLEHLEQVDSERALENMCRWSDDILFSSSPSDLDEPTHFNVQPVEYWAELFSRQGFLRQLEYDAGYITPWAMRLMRSQQTLPLVVADYERALWRLSDENRELRQAVRDVQGQGAALEAALASRVAELQVLRASLSWQVGQALGPIGHRLVPPDSRRARLVSRALSALRR
jgi:hypothetical protein